MKKFIISFFIALFVSSNVWAYSCSADMKAIDIELRYDGAKISEEQLAVVQYLRDVGEAFHKSGDHDASVIVLKTARKLLGI